MNARYHELLRGSLVGGPGKREEHRRQAKIVALLVPQLGAHVFFSSFPEATTKSQISFVTCLL